MDNHCNSGLVWSGLLGSNTLQAEDIKVLAYCLTILVQNTAVLIYFNQLSNYFWCFPLRKAITDQLYVIKSVEKSLPSFLHLERLGVFM